MLYNFRAWDEVSDSVLRILGTRWDLEADGVNGPEEADRPEEIDKWSLRARTAAMSDETVEDLRTALKIHGMTPATPKMQGRHSEEKKRKALALLGTSPRPAAGSDHLWLGTDKPQLSPRDDLDTLWAMMLGLLGLEKGWTITGLAATEGTGQNSSLFELRLDLSRHTDPKIPAAVLGTLKNCGLAAEISGGIISISGSASPNDRFSPGTHAHRINRVFSAAGLEPRPVQGKLDIPHIEPEIPPGHRGKRKSGTPRPTGTRRPRRPAA
ncbi:MAG: hypothetical protein M3O22_03940 [Pseudomonadota bacterium]|nr:hypothetical protein [Pseudomonadota bacterium]